MFSLPTCPSDVTVMNATSLESLNVFRNSKKGLLNAEYFLKKQNAEMCDITLRLLLDIIWAQTLYSDQTFCLDVL